MTTVAAAETALTRAAQAANELASDFFETRSVTLEWKVTNLKHLFTSSTGETKSKCVKSALFDSQKWQVFFYPNSGHEQYCSLYLSCEPTAAEKEKGLAERAGWGASGGKGAQGGKEGGGKDAGPSAKDAKGPWKREGKFKFTFEARSLDRRMTFKQMEAHDHSFSDTARNWGYANFLKRSDAYFTNPSVRLADAFLIVCTIVYSPTPPSPPPLPRLLIPKDLVNAYASLFDDPDYSDVCFRIRPEGTKRERRLYAAKKILGGRSDYFDTMFNSGFNESSVQPVSLPPSPTRPSLNSATLSSLQDDDDEAEMSDDDESTSDWDEDDDSEIEDDLDAEGEELENEGDESDGQSVDATTADSHVHGSSSAASVVSSSEDDEDEVREGEVEGDAEAGGAGRGEKDGTGTPSRRRTQSDLGGSAPFVDAPSAPSSPARTPISRRSNSTLAEADEEPVAVAAATTPPTRRDSKTSCAPLTRKASKKDDKPKRPMFEVVVTDAAYTSFRALIYYLYTDSITFSPLASNYHSARELALQQDTPFPFPTRRSYLLATAPPAPQTDPANPGPCSAKAIYRLADKIGLPELKERAYDHIVKSLTVQNIPYEVFGSFSLRFEEIKRVEIAFLLDRWNEVRESSSLKKVFQFGLLRVGRFPGFEEVMLRILPNLEFRAPPTNEEERV
ncbi:hypothetical protein RQP46_009583 [Phenoliferia psychrophenolica]